MWRKLLPVALITVSVLAPLAAYVGERRSPLRRSDVPGWAGRGSGEWQLSGLPLRRDGANQPALSEAQWRTEVEKKRTAYKAPIDPKDVDKIISYLHNLSHH
jgi:hypothetical protein